jgi:hypothetical protein
VLQGAAGPAPAYSLHLPLIQPSGLQLETHTASWQDSQARLCAGFRVPGQDQNSTLTFVDEQALQGWVTPLNTRGEKGGKGFAHVYTRAVHDISRCAGSTTSPAHQYGGAERPAQSPVGTPGRFQNEKRRRSVHLMESTHSMEIDQNAVSFDGKYKSISIKCKNVCS